MKVLGIEDGGACGHYRVRLPFDQMQANGLDVAYATEALILPEHDIIVGQRVGSPGFEHLWLKLWRDHKIVFETDDDLWTIDPTNTRAVRALPPELLTSVEQVARIAHMVTVSTEPLAEVMRRFNPNVHVLPNHIDGALLDIERKRPERLTIGWAGGDSHLRDWDLVAPRIRRVLARNPHVDLHTMGANYQRLVGHSVVETLDNDRTGVGHRHTTWMGSLDRYYGAIDFDIGIAPLVSSVFNRSKSAIKALEYAALGIPVVASDVGPYSDFVEDGVTGFLIRYDHEWEARLRDLINDEAMRAEMGAAAKEKARAWTIQDGWKLWADAYATLA